MPFVQTLTIQGFRGFAQAREFRPAIPDRAMPGSGLTIVVGPNNAGKSSLTEALVAVAQDQLPTFHVGQRNSAADSRVRIELKAVGDHRRILRTIDAGGAPTQFEGNIPDLKLFCVPSRRQFDTAFGHGEFSRDDLARQIRLEATRQRSVPLQHRLQSIARNAAEKRRFDAVLTELMGYTPIWTIEQHETGQYYLKYTVGAHSHSSDGLGDGIVGLFSIAAAVFDRLADTILVIDEPELSLHPQFQRRVLKKLVAASVDCQVIVATHSPLFISWPAIANGAAVLRVVREDAGVTLHSLSATSKATIRGFLNDQNNPHVLGLDASEVFFYEDRVILVEGQEDAVLLPEAARQAGTEIQYPMFGWGVGGASKMGLIAAILKDLGFKHVVGILDGDKVAVRDSLARDFPEYQFVVLPANDIRTRPASQTAARDGLLDEDRRLRANLTADFSQLVTTVNLRLGA
jgi:predicted ATPase